MNAFKNLSSYTSDETGANLIEYVLLAVLIAVISIVSVEMFGSEVGTRISSSAETLFP